jgi:hypothetical protein
LGFDGSLERVSSAIRTFERDGIGHAPDCTASGS